MMIFLDIEPLSKPVAISEMVILLAVAALIGWLIGRSSTNGKIKSLREKLAADEFDLDECREKTKKIGEESGTALVAKTDNLKLIEGIGPKIEQLLNSKGIYSFAQLADTKPAVISNILNNAGSRFQIHDPGSWSIQAALARDGKWDELSALQDKLDGGREA